MDGCMDFCSPLHPVVMSTCQLGSLLILSNWTEQGYWSRRRCNDNDNRFGSEGTAGESPHKTKLGYCPMSCVVYAMVISFGPAIQSHRSLNTDRGTLVGLVVDQTTQQYKRSSWHDTNIPVHRHHWDHTMKGKGGRLVLGSWMYFLKNNPTCHYRKTTLFAP